MFLCWKNYACGKLNYQLNYIQYWIPGLKYSVHSTLIPTEGINCPVELCTPWNEAFPRRNHAYNSLLHSDLDKDPGTMTYQLQAGRSQDRLMYHGMVPGYGVSVLLNCLLLHGEAPGGSAWIAPACQVLLMLISHWLCLMIPSVEFQWYFELYFVFRKKKNIFQFRSKKITSEKKIDTQKVTKHRHTCIKDG